MGDEELLRVALIDSGGIVALVGGTRTFRAQSSRRLLKLRAHFQYGRARGPSSSLAAMSASGISEGWLSDRSGAQSCRFSFEDRQCESTKRRRKGDAA